jgi:hypothetical protein
METVIKHDTFIHSEDDSLCQVGDDLEGRVRLFRGTGP